MHEYFDISLIFVASALLGFFAVNLKQPLILAYILVGFILSAFGLVDPKSLSALSQVGVTLLLFLLGLEMNLKELFLVGRVSFITGLSQFVFTFILGLLIALALKLPLIPSAYIACALTFSSTIIMVRLLSEKKDLGSLYGRIAIGFLLIQDLIAIGILVFLGSGSKNFELGFLSILLKFILLFLLVWLMSRKIGKIVFDRFAVSPELLFIASLAWVLGFSAFVVLVLGFSIEIGGLLAGISLSNLPESLQITSKTKPLRDFFMVIFFVSLGSQLVLGADVLKIFLKALAFSFLVLVGDPLIVMAILGFLGYKKRTSFMAGLTVAQTSEFSFILMSLGERLGHVKGEHSLIVVLVAAITMVCSTYMILKADYLYNLFSPYLGFFERKKLKEKSFLSQIPAGLKNHIVLVGCDRTGERLLDFLSKIGNFVIVDFNPKVVDRLLVNNYPVIFGDINDQDVFEKAGIAKSSLIISTINSFADNKTFLENIKRERISAKVIMTSSNEKESNALYEEGANLVLIPEKTTGEYIKHILRVFIRRKTYLDELRERILGKS